MTNQPKHPSQSDPGPAVSTDPLEALAGRSRQYEGHPWYRAEDVRAALEAALRARTAAPPPLPDEALIDDLVNATSGLFHASLGDGMSTANARFAAARRAVSQRLAAAPPRPHVIVITHGPTARHGYQWKCSCGEAAPVGDPTETLTEVQRHAEKHAREPAASSAAVPPDARVLNDAIALETGGVVRDTSDGPRIVGGLRLTEESVDRILATLAALAASPDARAREGDA